jgi:hypothetical protein
MKFSSVHGDSTMQAGELHVFTDYKVRTANAIASRLASMSWVHALSEKSWCRHATARRRARSETASTVLRRWRMEANHVSGADVAMEAGEM